MGQRFNRCYQILKKVQGPLIMGTDLCRSDLTLKSIPDNARMHIVYLAPSGMQPELDTAKTTDVTMISLDRLKEFDLDAPFREEWELVRRTLENLLPDGGPNNISQ